MAPTSFTGTPVVGSMKSSVCDEREVDADEAACWRVGKLWLVENG